MSRILGAVVDEGAGSPTVDGPPPSTRSLRQDGYVVGERRLSGIAGPLRIAIVADLERLEHQAHLHRVGLALMEDHRLTAELQVVAHDVLGPAAEPVVFGAVVLE